MVVEEDDEYITTKNLEEKEVKQKDTTQYSYVSRSSANMPQYNMASNSYNSVPKMASIPMMATTGRPNLAQRYATFENENTKIFPELKVLIKGHSVQGVQGQTFMFQLALTDRNMQARFNLKVVWES